MNTLLHQMASASNLSAPEAHRLRIAFGLACATRVRHLIESDAVLALLSRAQAWLASGEGAESLAPLALAAQQQARSHPGSRSIDGTAHAAVSATHAVAAALNGRALDAADYAAVYAYASAAVTDPQAYGEEHGWQVSVLQGMLGHGGADGGRSAGRPAMKDRTQQPLNNPLIPSRDDVA